MYKYSLITVNFGKYDKINEPDVIDPDCEYVYVTDDPKIKSKNFKVIILDKLRNKSNLYKAFYVRYHIEQFVRCKLCVWVDGSVHLHKSLAPIINEFIKSKADMCCPIHYIKGSTFDFVRRWFEDHKNNPKKMLPKFSYLKAKEYINHNFSASYKGHAEANFQILKLDNLRVKHMRNEIWKDILELGYKGDPFRVDEMVLSVKLQTKYKNIKLFMVQRQILQSSFMSWYKHMKKEKIPRKAHIPDSCIFYFYNRPQKVHVFK